MRALENPTYMVAKKNTKCPVCLRWINRTELIGNPGWDKGWCHANCCSAIYTNVRPSYPSVFGPMVEVDYFDAIDRRATITSTANQSVVRQIKEMNMNFEINPNKPLPDVYTDLKRVVQAVLVKATNLKKLTQPSAMGLLCNDAYHRTDKDDGARQQFLDAYHGKLNDKIRDSRRRRVEEELFPTEVA